MCAYLRVGIPDDKRPAAGNEVDGKESADGKDVKEGKEPEVGNEPEEGNEPEDSKDVLGDEDGAAFLDDSDDGKDPDLLCLCQVRPKRETRVLCVMLLF